MTYYQYNEGGQLTTHSWHNLSRDINYLLTASPLNELALLQKIIGYRPPSEYMEPLLEAIRFLLLGYGDDKRKCGTPAILHPLRTAAILSQRMPRFEILDLLGAFLHDRDEDLREGEIEPIRWSALQQRLERLLGLINSNVQWFLGERIEILSRRKNQTYFEYLNRILDHADTMPDLIRIKLADKLDSTYDIQVPLSSLEEIDFHQVVFEILYVPSYKGIMSHWDVFLVGEREALLFLSSIAKNAIFLSLLRKTGLDRKERTITTLFDALAVASIRQARWILLELFATSISSVDEQRKLLKDVLSYREEGVITKITSKERGHCLDGTFLEHFNLSDDASRKQRMKELYEDKHHFARVIASMLVIFYCFLGDKRFSISGIDTTGINSVI
jgi:hypothetical protein